MLCEKCKKNEATVYVSQIINGVSSEYHLCAACAGENEIAPGLNIPYDKLMQALIESFSNLQAAQTQSTKPDTQKTQAELSGIRCPVCALGFEQFRSTGKIGCAECYNAFHNELNQIIKSIQGASIHEGKVPKRENSNIAQMREIGKLREKLKTAVEAEEFEYAAQLRDQIRAMEL